MRRSVQAYVNLVLVVTSVATALLLGEVGCRLAGYTVPPPAPRLGNAPRYYYKADPVNGHDISENFIGGPFGLSDYISINGAPYTVSSNSLGCRDRSFDQEDGYVLLLGDSFTWGYVPLEQTWGATLEQLIGIKVLKCGVGGYGPRHERHKLETVVAKAGRPSLVIVGYMVANDLLDDYLYPGRTVIDGYMVNKVVLADTKKGDRRVYSEDELRAKLKSVLEQKPAGLMTGVRDIFVERSAVYNLLRNSEAFRRMASRLGITDPPVPGSWEVFRSIAAFPWLDQAWEAHFANLRQLKSAVEATGATMVVVLIPNLEQVYEFLRPQDDSVEWEYPNKRLTEFFQREEIAFLDLLPEFRKHASPKRKPMLDAHEDLYWPHDGHLNVKGNRLFGLLISRYVLEHPFLQVQDKDKRLSDIKQLLSASTDAAR